jgi:hypothetical protein
LEEGLAALLPFLLEFLAMVGLVVGDGFESFRCLVIKDLSGERVGGM